CPAARSNASPTGADRCVCSVHWKCKKIEDEPKLIITMPLQAKHASTRLNSAGDRHPAGDRHLAVAASFGRASRTYGTRSGVQAAMAGWLSEWLPANRFGRVLEIGAGTGLFTRHLFPWDGS